MEIFKKRDFGELIGETISFLVKNFKFLSLSIILFVGPLVLLNTLLAQHYGLAMQNQMLSLIQSGGNPFDYIRFGPLFIMWVIGILQSIVMFTLIASYVKVYAQLGKGNFGISEIWNEFLKHIGQTIIAMGLAAIMIFVVTFIFILPGLYVSRIFNLIAIIPGTYLAVVFYILTPIIVFERNGFSGGMSRAFQLIKGNWWKALGAFLILAILAFIANLIVSGIFRMIFRFTYGSLTLMAFSSVIIGIVSMIISSVTSIFPVYLYTSILAEEENPALMEQINKMTEDKEDVNIFEVKDNTTTDDTQKENSEKWTDLKDEEEKKNRFDDNENETDRFKPKY